METGAIVAVTTHGGAAADTSIVEETEAAVGVAGLLAEQGVEGKQQVHAARVEAVVADKGYHGNEVLRSLTEGKFRTYIAEPERVERNWNGKAAKKKAVHANRRRIGGERGKRLQTQRGETLERNFAHQFDTGGLDRLYVRGIENVHNKLLLHAAACNLALRMRTFYGAGKPRAAHDRVIETILAILPFIKSLRGAFEL